MLTEGTAEGEQAAKHFGLDNVFIVFGRLLPMME
jgi:hypothetical protein